MEDTTNNVKFAKGGFAVGYLRDASGPSDTKGEVMELTGASTLLAASAVVIASALAF